MSVIIAAIIAVLVGVVLVTLRAVVGPHLYDRLLAANSFGTLIVILIVLMGQLVGTAFFVDIALVYALINFITTIGILRYVQHKERREKA